MEEIKSYLDKMFSGLPKTEKVLKARRELLAMMTDKYEALLAEGKNENEALGTVIMQFGNLNELAEELELTEEIRNAEESRVVLTRRDVEPYVATDEKKALYYGLGSAVLILAPSLLIISAGLQDIHGIEAIWKLSLVGGFLTMFILAVIGAGLLLYANSLTPKLSELRKMNFSLDSDAADYVALISRKVNQLNTFLTIGAVGLFILAAVPPSLTAIIVKISENASLEPLIVISIVGTLLFAAIGVFLIYQGEFRKKTLRVFSAGKDTNTESVSSMSPQNKALYKKTSAIVWGATPVAYLIVSFTTRLWGFTWLIFPIVSALMIVIAILLGSQDPKGDAK